VGYRTALLIAAICVGSLLIMALLDVNGMPLPSYFPGEPLPNWVNFAVALVIALVPIARVVQILREALARSQSAEAALRQHQENLEEVVEERTAELVQARNQAQTANNAKSVFLASMSHELRTPLNAILGFSDLLREDSITDRQRQHLNIINRSGEYLLNLINDVLDGAKIDFGRIEVVKTAIDLPDLVRDVTDLMRIDANQKGLEFSVEQPALLPRFIWSDARRLRQVLINLLGNAIKYTQHGTVILRVDVNGLDPLLLSFEVEDTGVGIAPEDQARIFDAFVQVGQESARKGTGLGLTITSQFVELMGGTIHVQSRTGMGSRFRVELPVESATEAEANLTAGDEARIIGLEPQQAAYRILIVEDEPENSRLLHWMLQSVGFQVRTAANGAEGVEVFRTWQPHFIWMDWRMPLMDGLEATRRIRILEGGRKVKIAAVTASVFASERESMLSAGVDDFVRKPYRRKDIFDCMTRHLGVRYRLAKEQQVPAGKTAVLRPEHLGALPKELRTELIDALAHLNITRVTDVINRVRERDMDLGSMLAERAARLQYSEILDAIATSNEDGSGKAHERI